MKYNLLCLLNCKQDMTHYGPARKRWEGGEQGEKVVQVLKHNFSSFNENWEYNLHAKYLINKTMEKIIYSNEDNYESHTLKKNLFIYDNPANAAKQYHLKNPLLLVITSYSEIGVLCGKYLWKVNDLSYVRTSCFPDLKDLVDLRCSWNKRNC